MNAMFPESFTEEYEEIMELMQEITTDYIVVQVVELSGDLSYIMASDPASKSDTWEEMYRLEREHPENGYLTLSVTEYENWVTTSW